MSTIEIFMGFEPIAFDHSMISPEEKSNGSRLLNKGKIYNVVEIRGSGLSRLSEIRASAVCPVMIEGEQKKAHRAKFLNRHSSKSI